MNIFEKYNSKTFIFKRYKRLTYLFLILIIVLLLLISLNTYFEIINKLKINNLNKIIKEKNKIIEDREETIKIYQGISIEMDVKYNSYYAKLREECREKYNLTKYQKRYDYFDNPVEDETEAFTIGANSEYGYRSIYPQTHQGTDLQVIGKIINPADGIVYKIGENEVAGRYMVMYYNIQGKEHLIVFFHCNQLLVKKGDFVKKKEPLAKYGSTGNSTGPHNHFGLYTKIDGIWWSENFYMNSFHKN